MQTFDQVMKDTPSVADVHVSSALGARARRKPKAAPIRPALSFGKKDDPESRFSLYVPISKTDDELHTVYGWASVNAEAGILVTDHQGDQISDHEMTKAAHEFVSASRHGGLLHAHKADGSAHKGGEVVESIVLTADVQKALGVDLGKTGWFIGYQVNDPDAWALVKSGTLKAFSIGGKAQRIPIGAIQ